MPCEENSQIAIQSNEDLFKVTDGIIAAAEAKVNASEYNNRTTIVVTNESGDVVETINQSEDSSPNQLQKSEQVDESKLTPEELIAKLRVDLETARNEKAEIEKIATSEKSRYNKEISIVRDLLTISRGELQLSEQLQFGDEQAQIQTWKTHCNELESNLGTARKQLENTNNLLATGNPVDNELIKNLEDELKVKSDLISRLNQARKDLEVENKSLKDKINGVVQAPSTVKKSKSKSSSKKKKKAAKLGSTPQAGIDIQTEDREDGIAAV